VKPTEEVGFTVSSAKLLSLRGRMAAHSRWARTPDRSGATAPARRGFAARFEREVDPEGKLPREVRARLAESARKAYFARLGYLSAKARRKR
jgi:hypothetical protein